MENQTQAPVELSVELFNAVFQIIANSPSSTGAQAFLQLQQVAIAYNERKPANDTASGTAERQMPVPELPHP